MTVEDAIASVEQIIEHRRLSKVQQLVFRQAWEGKSYSAIAREFDYDAGYIKDTGSKLWQKLSEMYHIKITKHNFRAALEQAVEKTQPASISWGEAVDVSIFYGRTQELTTLQTWIVQDRCRLITLLGMGGMGKTSLSVKLAEEMQDQFDFVVWRSLRDAPSIDELLTDLVQFLTQQQALLPDSSGGKLSCLIALLKRSRCLIVLDSFEAVLQSGKCAGTYRDGYGMYGELLKRVGEIAHQSCIVLTSREKPQEVCPLEGDYLPVRTLPLSGLDITSGRAILYIKGLKGTIDDLEQLIAHYRGNPLALKIAATSIQDMFAGNIARFLEQGSVMFNEIEDLFQQQCDRLSPLEQSITNRLAIHREPNTLAELQTDLANELLNARLIAVLESLHWRSLIDVSAVRLTQQPMESITDALIEYRN